MFSRRTKARFAFLINILVFPLYVYQWRRAADDHESTLFVPQWLIAGAGSQILSYWAYDHDLGAIRTDRWRRIALGVIGSGLGLTVFPREEAAQRNFSTGVSIGTIAYRLWYGVFRPLPGSDD